MNVLARYCRVVLITFAALALSGVASAAAPRNGARAAKSVPSGPPNALQGFSQNRDQPVHIQAAKLEVRDKQQVATFSGDVRVRQGDTDMRCRVLKVYYDRKKDDGQGKKTRTIKAATPGPGGEQSIRRLEAIGHVVVSQKDQTATGNLGIFDMKTNTVTLSGNVIMTQGQNVLRGDRLVVDLTTGVSRIESGKNGHGRVEGLFVPSGNGPVGKGPLGPIH
jgi:lipopolysaccharide export system protein LptA